MLGAIIGDVIGSPYEWDNIDTTDFPLYKENSHLTDDSVMTLATAEALLNNRTFVEAYQDFGKTYTDKGYGAMFHKWLFMVNPEPYGSYGNGSAMRVSPVGWAYKTLKETLEVAKISAECSHNHPEGIKGAQATAACIFLARMGASKSDIKKYISEAFKYDLNRTCDEIRPTYSFNESCQKTVPEAIIAYLESTSFEHCIRLAVSLGGDCDTLTCIAGSIAEAEYGIPEEIAEPTIDKMDAFLLEILLRFREKYNIGQ